MSIKNNEPPGFYKNGTASVVGAVDVPKSRVQRSPPKRKQSYPKLLAEPITPELLHDLLMERVLRKDHQGVLRKDQQMPADGALTQLAEDLEQLRGYLQQRNEDGDIFRKAARNAVAALETLIEAGATFAKGTKWPEQRKRLSKRLRTINDCRGVIERMIVPLAVSRMKWHARADMLRQAFITAMKSTNLGFSDKKSQTRPLALFIAAVAPYLTGESPTAGSVETWLKTDRKRRPALLDLSIK